VAIVVDRVLSLVHTTHPPPPHEGCATRQSRGVHVPRDQQVAASDELLGKLTPRGQPILYGANWWLVVLLSAPGGRESGVGKEDTEGSNRMLPDSKRSWKSSLLASG
jgi:hypothetical protein